MGATAGTHYGNHNFFCIFDWCVVILKIIFVSANKRTLTKFVALIKILNGRLTEKDLPFGRRCYSDKFLGRCRFIMFELVFGTN